MRILNGVVLILVAVIYLFAAWGYMVGGAVMGSMMSGEMSDAMGNAMQQAMSQAVQEAAKQQQGEKVTIAFSPEDQQKFEQTMQASFAQLGEAGQTGATFLFVYGVILLVGTGVLIAAAVFSFQGTGARFILGSALFILIIEGCALYLHGLSLWNLPGVVTAILAFVTAKQLADQSDYT